MTRLFRTALAEAVGLFVDDGSLAASAVALLALVGCSVKLARLDPLMGAALLLLGCLAILLASLHGFVRRRAGRRT